MNDKLAGRLREVGRRFFRLRADNYGVIAVVTVILFPVLLGITALALDVGRLQDLKRRQKNATIAAALSAGHELWQVHSDDAATAAAKEDAARNNFDEDDADRDITITVNIPPTSGNYAGVANHTEVFIEEQVSTYFAGVFGHDTVTVRSRAVTGLIKWGDACVIALEETRAHAMVISGTSTLATGWRRTGELNQRLGAVFGRAAALPRLVDVYRRHRRHTRSRSLALRQSRAD